MTERRTVAAGKRGPGFKSLVVEAGLGGYQPEQLVAVRCTCGGIAHVLQCEYVELAVVKGEVILCDNCVRGGK